MIVHTVRIPYKLGQTIRLRVLADWHVGNTHSDNRAARKFLDEDKDCYFIGNGDLMDMVIASDSKRYRKSSDDSDGDAIVDEQIEKIFSWLEPYKDRVLGLGTGNHEDEITKRCGTNPSQRLCKKLGVPFLGYSSLVRLALTENGNRGRSVVCRLHHGYGGGSRTQGADITKYSKDLNYWDADIFFYGHCHKLQSDRIPRLGLIGDKLVAKPKLLCITGSFLKTFGTTTDPTYSEKAGYPPLEIGGLTVNIKPDSSGVKYWVDM